MVSIHLYPLTDNNASRFSDFEINLFLTIVHQEPVPVSPEPTPHDHHDDDHDRIRFEPVRGRRRARGRRGAHGQLRGVHGLRQGGAQLPAGPGQGHLRVLQVS